MVASPTCAGGLSNSMAFQSSVFTTSSEVASASTRDQCEAQAARPLVSPPCHRGLVSLARQSTRSGSAVG